MGSSRLSTIVCTAYISRRDTEITEKKRWNLDFVIRIFVGFHSLFDGVLPTFNYSLYSLYFTQRHRDHREEKMESRFCNSYIRWIPFVIRWGPPDFQL